ncbi:MAG: ABC transporter permease [candidate division KSB1 bacterium]|nr:ABC transporter permease [candidate division KSB1 bacterium]
MAMFIKLAWRNVRRNVRRTLLTLSAIAVTVYALTFAQSYFKGALGGMYDNLIRTETGHIRIVHKDFLRRERMTPLEFLVWDYPTIEQQLQAIPGIERISQRLKFHVMLDYKGNDEVCLGIGLQPEKERDIMPLTNHITTGRYLQANEKEILLGTGLAEKLGIHVGDTLLVVTRTVYFSHDAMDFRVVGTFTTGLSSLDKHTFYLPFSKAQELLNAEGATTEIIIMLKQPHKAPDIAEQIASLLTNNSAMANYLVIPWQQQRFLRDMVPYIRTVSAILFGIIMFIAGLVIINTMLMAVMERTHEMGVMMALGLKGRSLVALFLLEAVIIALLGGILGGALGSGVSIWTEVNGIDLSAVVSNIEMPVPIYGAKLYPDFTMMALVKAILFGIITALVATAYPCYKAATLVPTEAIRRI